MGRADESNPFVTAEEAEAFGDGDMTKEPEAEVEAAAEPEVEAEPVAEAEPEAEQEEAIEVTAEQVAQEPDVQEEAAADAAEPVEAAAEPEPDKEPEAEKVEAYIPPAPVEDIDREALDKEAADLAAKLKEYDIQPEEYAEKMRVINDKIMKHETDTRIQEAIQNAEWRAAQQQFFSDNPEFWSDPVKHAALKGTLDILYGDEANMSKSNHWFLSEAKNRIQQTFGAPAPEIAAAPPPPKPQPVPKPETPKTLSSVPAAASETTGDRFSALDSKRGLDAEEAYASMSPEDQERYLMAGNS